MTVLGMMGDHLADGGLPSLGWWLGILGMVGNNHEDTR